MQIVCAFIFIGISLKACGCPSGKVRRRRLDVSNFTVHQSDIRRLRGNLFAQRTLRSGVSIIGVRYDVTQGSRGPPIIFLLSKGPVLVEPPRLGWFYILRTPVNQWHYSQLQHGVVYRRAASGLEHTRDGLRTGQGICLSSGCRAIDCTGVLATESGGKGSNHSPEVTTSRRRRPLLATKENQS